MMQKDKMNGEFDVALEFKDHLKIIEVKYCKSKLTVKEMGKEVKQIENTKTSLDVEYAFVATGGYEPSNYECVDISSLYNI